MAMRRFALYFAWSRRDETGAELGVLENRYPTLFEFRRALWPLMEGLGNPARHAQGVAGFLDHVILSDFERFREVVAQETGHRPAVIHRETDESQVHALDASLLSQFDTVIVVSLDHFRSAQHLQPAELDALRAFVNRPGSCLVVCPHHDIGAGGGLPEREIEHRHHGDVLVPGVQQIGCFGRSVMSALGFSVENRYGLSPAANPDGTPSALRIHRDLDRLGVLTDVTTFNLHPHLPHLAVGEAGGRLVQVLAEQPINPDAPAHPFVLAGHRSFNAFLQLEAGNAAGAVYACDATLWSSAFGGLNSLERLWRNLAHMAL
jgi:hypothetical protein